MRFAEKKILCSVNGASCAMASECLLRAEVPELMRPLETSLVVLTRSQR